MRNGIIDLIGQRFGKLIVISRAENNKFGSSRWLCECECGKTKIIEASHLKTGTKSCGCSRYKVKTPKIKPEPKPKKIKSKVDEKRLIYFVRKIEIRNGGCDLKDLYVDLISIHTDLYNHNSEKFYGKYNSFNPQQQLIKMYNDIKEYYYKIINRECIERDEHTDLH